MLIRIEAREDKEYGVVQLKLRGPEPKGHLEPINVNRHEMCKLVL